MPIPKHHPARSTAKVAQAAKVPPVIRPAPSGKIVVEKRGTFGLLARAYRLHGLMYDQQENDNRIRPWITIDHIADELTGGKTKGARAVIRALQDDFGLPLGYLESRKGWGYLEKVDQFPFHVSTRGESMGLCVAMLGTAMYAGTPFAEEARRIIKKLTAGLRREAAVEFEALEKSVSFHCTGAEAYIRPEAFDLTTLAVIHHHELEIDYSAASRVTVLDGTRDAESGIRRVEPLHVACIDFGWYLFAFDLQRQEIRTFALRRIRALRLTGRGFQPRRFDVKKELAHSFGPFLNREPETVRLLFWGHAANVIPEFIWHPSQKITPCTDVPGEIELSLRVSINPRFLGWIKEWLCQVSVLEPVSLRQRVSEEARTGAALSDARGAEYDRRKAGEAL
jgi:proteasome accessory factor B